MEDVLKVYQRPFDPKRPLVTLDEGSKQLLEDSQQALPIEPGQALREDYEYVRNGVTSFYMLFAPLLCWRHVQVTGQRTKREFAYVLKDLADVHFPDAKTIVLVLDNLNTHVGGSLYDTFSPEEASRLADKFEIHYTPKHGSWLNMAEIELSVLGRQCLDRRIPDVEVLKREIAAWEEARNAAECTVRWHFTAEDARIKLMKLYPCILP